MMTEAQAVAALFKPETFPILCLLGLLLFALAGGGKRNR